MGLLRPALYTILCAAFYLLGWLLVCSCAALPAERISTETNEASRDWREPGRRMMSNLNLGIEIRDFDLERMGFSLSVLDDSKKRQASEAYLRMTLLELHSVLNALKAANEIVLTTYDSNGVNKLPPLKGVGGVSRHAQL